jgi:hypothetical protein
MKKLLTSLLAGVLLLPAVLSGATFEGAVRIKMTSGKDTVETDYLLKNNRARATMHMGKQTVMTTITDYDKMETLMLMPEQKMYMVVSMKSVIDNANANAAQDPKFKFEKTGVKEKILGYTCEKYLMTSSDTNMEMWMTEELGTYMGMANAMNGRGGRGQAPQTQGWEKAIAGKNLFPMRMIGLDLKGKENFRWETVSVDKKSVPDSEFTPPADFQKFQMPAMGDMMKGMMKGMIPGR